MCTDIELLEVIKNGKLHPGECLLVINSETYRIMISDISLNYDYSNAIPSFDLSGVVIGNGAEMATAIMSQGE